MLSCGSQEDSGPDVQKAWKRLLTNLFLFVCFFGFFGHWVKEAIASTVNQGLPGSRSPGPGWVFSAVGSVDVSGPFPEHTHPATVLLVPLRQGWQKPDLGSGM